MNTLLERGLSMLARTAPKAAGGRIIYSRGDDAVWLDATWGRTEFNVDAGDGSVRVEHSDRDFIVDADCLILGGQLAKPQRGDRITVVNEERGDQDVYEVLAPSGEAVYRPCDSEGRMIRVHGKKLQ